MQWQIADSARAFQDEYLEWSVERDDQNNIASVSFTCEGPEVGQSAGVYLYQLTESSTGNSMRARNSQMP